MEKEFIEYEQALALKELGFNEPCLAFRDFGYSLEIGDITKNSSWSSEIISVPLYQQAFRWFREKHNFDVGIAKDSHDIYHFQIDTNYYGNWILPIFNRNYEEAELECLKKLIEIVKNKKKDESNIIV